MLAVKRRSLRLCMIGNRMEQPVFEQPQRTVVGTA